MHLNIELSFQKKVEEVVSEMKGQTAAEEVMAAVMDSQTGALLALATSERFNPAHIYQKNVNSLNPNCSEYVYEPGSVIKPLTMAIALEQNKVDLTKQIRLGRKLALSKIYTIKDDLAIFEGDIILGTVEQAEAWRELNENSQIGSGSNSIIRTTLI